MAPQDKDRNAQQLKSLEVHEANEVSVELWVKNLDGSTVRGKLSAGRVKLAVTPDSGGLKIYLTRRDLDAEYPPYDLCEAIQTFYRIVDPERAALLQQVLLPLEESSIVQLLERRGVIVTESRWAEGHDDEEHGLPGKHEDTYSGNDPFLGFIRDIEGAADVDRVLSRRWEQNSAVTSPLLTQLCQRDNQNASLLLPGGYLPQVERRGAPCLDGAQILEYRRLEHGEPLTQGILAGASVVWPAVFISSREDSSVVVFGNEDKEAYDVDIELAFLGEYMVSQTVKSE